MHNVINIISAVSVFGIMISTAALVIVLASFSGMENLVSSFYSDFYQDIKIESKNTKTFERSFIPDEVYQVEGLVNYSKVVEDIVMVKYEEQFIFSSVKGVEPSFIEMSRMADFMDEGIPVLEDQYGPWALVGTQAMMNLNAWIYAVDGSPESITLYAPNRNKKIKRNSLDNFTTSKIYMGGNYSYGTDASDSYVIVPIDFASDILNYKDEISSIEMDFSDDVDLEAKKEELKEILGPSFTVKTSFEQNEIIYKTNKSEKWMTAFLLAFIFFLATFNMVATITMIVIEKKSNLNTLWSLGAKKSQIERIFFYEGLLINGIGMVLGLALGYGVCLLQMTLGLISIPNGVVDYFPVALKIDDLLLILSITLFFGILAAYLPGKILIKRILN